MMRQPDMFAAPRARAAGRVLRETGKARVTGKTDPAWKAAVEAACEDWLRTSRPGWPFTGEDLRMECQCKVPQPHHPNAWSAVIGAVLRRWIAAGRVARSGATEASDPKAHARLIRTYRTVEVG